MGDTPTTTNQAAQTVNSIISAVIYDVALSAGEAALFAEVPFLGLPLIRPIVEILMRFVAGYIYRPLAKGATLNVITFQTGAQKDAYTKAEANLHAAHLAGNPILLDQATAEFKAAFRALVHSDGNATP